MTILAHLSDIHLLEDKPETRAGSSRWRFEWLTFGRNADPQRRRQRLARALDHAKAAGADHLVLTGDLTEDGLDAQFAALADVLDASAWRPENVTILPGNHDAYHEPGAFDRALRGPLAKYAKTSGAGAVIELPGVTLLGLSSAIAQSWALAGGAIDLKDLERAKTLAAETRKRNDAFVVALHHPPDPRSAPFEWLIGLRDARALMQILNDHDHAFLLHGHTHSASDRAVRPGATARIFCAPSVVGSDLPLRLYSARHGRLTPEPWFGPEGVMTLAAGF